MKNKVLNIVIFYDNYDEVLKYLKSLSLVSDGCVDVLIVFNSDKDGRFNELKQYLDKNGNQNVSLKTFGENVGYLNSMLFSIEDIDVEKYDFVILSNTDIEYRQRDFFNVLLSKKYDCGIGCIAPSVYASKTNSYSNPHYVSKVSKRKIKQNRFIFSIPFLATLMLKLGEFKAKKRNVKLPSRYVYCPHGCYMIFTKQFIKKITGYHYGVRLYNEEGCVGGLLERYSFKCFYDSDLEVVHQESTTTGKINQKKRFLMWKESFDYLLDEFY